jgi:hypothetical protein
MHNGSKEPIELSRFGGNLPQDAVNKAVSRAQWLSETDAKSRAHYVQVRIGGEWFTRMTYVKGKLIQPERAA